MGVEPGRRSIARRVPGLRGASIVCRDYREASPAPGDLVYLDPPYSGSTGYAAVGRFDSCEFWQVAECWARRGVCVVVSEEAAPAGWRVVWEAGVPLSEAGGKVETLPLFGGTEDGGGPRRLGMNMDRLYAWRG